MTTHNNTVRRVWNRKGKGATEPPYVPVTICRMTSRSSVNPICIDLQMDPPIFSLLSQISFSVKRFFKSVCGIVFRFKCGYDNDEISSLVKRLRRDQEAYEWREGISIMTDFVSNCRVNRVFAIKVTIQVNLMINSKEDKNIWLKK